MSEMIQKTKRKMYNFNNYDGVCHDCNSPQKFSGVITVIVLEETEEYVIGLPIDWFICGTCGENVRAVRFYKSLNITKELSKV